MLILTDISSKYSTVAMFVVLIFEILKVVTVKVRDSAPSPSFYYKNEPQKELQISLRIYWRVTDIL
jgi:hypothetical protein